MSEIQTEIEETYSRSLVFHGTGKGYFKIWIVNVLLTIVTLGVYGAWALVRSKRYLYNHTELSGSRFDYKATGGTIFVSWLCLLIYIFALEGALIGRHSLTAAAMVLLLILFLPYLFVQSIRYQMQSTTLNNVRFNFKCSGFKAWWVMLGCPLLMGFGVGLICVLIMSTCSSATLFDMQRIIITAVIAVLVGILGMGIIQGVATALGLNLLFNNLSFGKQTFSSDISFKKCITICLISISLMIPFILIVLYLVLPVYIEISSMAFLGNPVLVAEKMNSLQATITVAYLIYLFGIIICASFLYVKMRNYYYSAVVLSGRVAFRSTLTISGFMGQVIINLLITVCTLGFGYPWARVRYCHYLANNTWVDGDLDSLNLEDHEDKVATDIVSRLSRGLVPNISL